MFEDEALERLHIRHHDAQQIVRVARHQIALHYFRALGDGLFEALQRFFHLFLQTHLNKHVDAQPERLRIQQRDLLLEQPQLLERAHPVKARRGRQVDRASQLGIGDAGVLLQLAEDADIDAVQPFRRCCHR